MVFLALAPLLLLAPSASAAQAGSAPAARDPAGGLAVGGRRRGGWRAGDDRRSLALYRAVLARWPSPGPVRLQPGSGGYTAIEGVLTLTPLAVTTALCPPDSHGATFQRLLEQATAYRFDPEAGHLVLRGEAGALDLQPA